MVIDILLGQKDTTDFTVVVSENCVSLRDRRNKPDFPHNEVLGEYGTIQEAFERIKKETGAKKFIASIELN